MEQLYTIISPNVVQETFDDEAVVVSLTTGFYYSLNETATRIWSQLVAGKHKAAIIDWMAHHYDVDAALIEAAINSLIEELLQEELIREWSGVPAAIVECANESNEIVKKVFTAPVISKYTDVQELLVLDPIHDVDERGWPLRRSAGQP